MRSNRLLVPWRPLDNGYDFLGDRIVDVVVKGGGTIHWYTDAVHVDYEHAIRVINDIPKLYS